MKYFFLSEHWTTGRVWEFGGLWNELAWQRKPHLRKRSLCIKEHGETLCLYEAEESILMVEVLPKALATRTSDPAIGQVVLKRLLSAEQAIERLCEEEDIFQTPMRHSTGHISTGRISTGHISTGRISTDNISTDNISTGRISTDNISTDNISTDNINTDSRGNELSSGDNKQRLSPTDTGEATSAHQTWATKASRINQEPVAINSDREQT